AAAAEHAVDVEFELCAYKDLAAGDGGDCKLDRRAAAIATAGGLVAVVDLVGEVGGVVGVQRADVVDRIALDGPQHGAGGRAGRRRDHRLRPRIAERGRRLRGGRRAQQTV